MVPRTSVLRHAHTDKTFCCRYAAHYIRPNLTFRDVCCFVRTDGGAAYGTAKAGMGIGAMGVMHPQLVMRNIIPVVMAGVLGIYGLIVSVILLSSSEACRDVVALYFFDRIPQVALDTTQPPWMDSSNGADNDNVWHHLVDRFSENVYFVYTFSASLRRGVT